MFKLMLGSSLDSSYYLLIIRSVPPTENTIFPLLNAILETSAHLKIIIRCVLLIFKQNIKSSITLKKKIQ